MSDHALDAAMKEMRNWLPGFDNRAALEAAILTYISIVPERPTRGPAEIERYPFGQIIDAT